jgi:hypothetical protein
VTVTDASGNPVSGTNVTFVVASGGGSVTSPNPTTNAAGQAFVTSWTLGTTAGSQTLVATSIGLAGSPVTFTATALAGSASKLAFTTAPVGTTGGATLPAFAVSAEDAFGNIVTSFNGAVAIAFGTTTSGATLGGTVSVNAVAGVATFSTVTINKAFAGYTLVASSGSLTGATSAGFNIVTGPPTTIASAGGTGQTGPAGVALPTPVAVRVTDAGGNGVTGATVTFATPNGSVSPTSGTTDINGLLITTWTLGATPGAQSMTATSGSLTNSPLTITATATASGVDTWTGASSTVWSDVNNWASAAVPLTTDSVVVPVTANAPTVSGAVNIKALIVAPGATLTSSSATVTVASTLSALGGIVGNGSVVLTSATGATVQGNINPALTISGLYTANGVIATNTLVVNAGSLDINGQTVAVGVGGVSTSGTGTIKMTSPSGALTSNGPATFQGGSETGKLTAGALAVAGNFTEGGGGAAPDAFNAGPAFQTLLNATVASTFTFNDPNNSAFGALFINDAAGVTALSQFQVTDLTLTAGVLSGSTGATIYGTLTDPLAHWAAGNISFASSTTPVSASTPTITPAAQITFNNNPSVLAANLTVNGTVNVQGNLVPNGHTLTVSGVSNGFATSANGQLTMTNPADVVSVAGNVTFGSASSGGPMSAGTLAIGGNFMQSGSSQSISTSGTNTILFNGSGTQTVIFSSPDGNFAAGVCVAACVQNLTVNKPSGALNFLTTVKVQGDFVNNSSAATVSTPVSSLNQPFIIAGNAAFGLNGAFHVTGIGGTTFSKGAGTTVDTVTYFGASQPYNPGTLGEFYSDIRGTANWTGQGTLNGQMVVDGQLNVSTGGAVVTGNFSTAGVGTLRMSTNPTDVLAIGGVATFGGGSTNGLLTQGSVVITGPAINVTGEAYDEIGGTHTTIVNGSSGTQTLSWTAPVAGHGYNNLTMQGASFKQFSGDQYITGTLLFDPAMTGTVSGSYNIYVNNLADNSSIPGGGWNGSTALHLTGNGGTLPPKLGVNTVYFEGGGNVVLQQNLTTNYITVDNGTGLVLNGHTVNLQGNYFTTQTGGFLQMTAANDSLIANQLYFNGGSTVGALTNGVINVTGGVFGVLYQGYSAGHIAVPGASATAFAASGTQVRFNAPSVTQVAFANPGTGSGGSHFGLVQATNGAPITLQSDVFVDSLLAGDIPGESWNSDAPGTTVHTITTNGINNTGTSGMTMNGVNVVLNNGLAASPFFSNVTWTGFPASYTGTLLTVNRSASAPVISLNNFTAITLGVGGEYINNIGAATLGISSNIGGCLVTGLLGGGHCP